jgi:hypothetical protein
MLDLLRDNWDTIKDQLIAAIDANYGVYDGRTFKADRFSAWLAHRIHDEGEFGVAEVA